MSVNLPDQPQSQSSAERDFLMLMAAIFMAVLGVTMFLFSLSYIKDLETLQALPDMIWSFACGRPVENGVALPLLATLSLVSFLGCVILLIARQWLKKQSISE